MKYTCTKIAMVQSKLNGSVEKFNYMNKFYFILLVVSQLCACTGHARKTVNELNGKQNTTTVARLRKAKVPGAVYVDSLVPIIATVNDSFSICFFKDTLNDVALGLYFNTELPSSTATSNIDLPNDVLRQVQEDSAAIIVNGTVARLEGERGNYSRLYPIRAILIDSVKSYDLFIQLEFVSYLKEQYSYDVMLKLDSLKRIVKQKMIYASINIDKKSVLDSLKRAWIE